MFKVFRDKFSQHEAAVALDLGSGTGLLTAFCAQAGFNNIVASDKSPVSVEIIYQHLNIEYLLLLSHIELNSLLIYLDDVLCC